MKKYTKPNMLVEEISVKLLTMSCQYRVDDNGEPKPFDMGGGINLFMDDNLQCTFTPDNMGIEVCYNGHDPEDNHNLFLS